MKIAVAVMTSEIDSEVAKHGARAPCYLLFDNRGALLEAIANPYSEVERGAAPRVATLLADRGVTLVAAGDFGPRFVAELERSGIDIVLRSGPVSDIVRHLTDLISGMPANSTRYHGINRMSDKGTTLDLEKALQDPGSVFSGPEELRDHRGLTGEQKIDLLRRWAYDASELAVAEEEGMVGGEPSKIARILAVLDELTDGFDVEHSPPTKQEGV